MIYLTGATPGVYHAHALQLAHSVARFGRSLGIAEFAPTGRWESCAALKARAMAHCLAEHDAVCWLDADSRMVAEPVAIEEAYQAGVHLAAHWRDGLELLSGTLLLAGDPGREICRRWIAAIEANPSEWDQRLLELVWRGVPGVRAAVLPAAYCMIPEFMPGVVPVMLELQESRRQRQGASQ